MKGGGTEPREGDTKILKRPPSFLKLGQGVGALKGGGLEPLYIIYIITWCYHDMYQVEILGKEKLNEFILNA